MNSDEIKRRRLELEEILTNSQVELGRIKGECKHENIAKGRLTYSFRESKVVQTYRPVPLLSWERWESVTMYCQCCDKDFGWYCPNNPEGYCVYNEDEDGYDGECVFCGYPEERK